RVLEQRLAPDHALHERARRLARPEAGHLQPTGHPTIGLVHRPLEAGRVDLDLEHDLTLLDFLRADLHRRWLPFRPLREARRRAARPIRQKWALRESPFADARQA